MKLEDEVDDERDPAHIPCVHVQPHLSARRKGCPSGVAARPLQACGTANVLHTKMEGRPPDETVGNDPQIPLDSTQNLGGDVR
jgi:hypothetical protein